MSSTGWIIIAVVVIVVLVIGFVARSRRRSRELAMRRVAAAAHRRRRCDQETHTWPSWKPTSRQRALNEPVWEAEETAARADQARTTAQEHQALAAEIDPDGEGAETVHRFAVGGYPVVGSGARLRRRPHHERGCGGSTV